MFNFCSFCACVFFKKIRENIVWSGGEATKWERKTRFRERESEGWGPTRWKENKRGNIVWKSISLSEKTLIHPGKAKVVLQKGLERVKCKRNPFYWFSYCFRISPATYLVPLLVGLWKGGISSQSISVSPAHVANWQLRDTAFFVVTTVWSFSKERLHLSPPKAFFPW